MSSVQERRQHGYKEVQLQLPLQLQQSSQEAPTGTLLRFPWGSRLVADPVEVSSFTKREAAYLNWVFRDGFRTSETKANHLLFTALPRSYYQGKLIRDGKNKRQRRGQWPTHGYT